jgi:heme-degrading monooxygenase HmoA
MIANWKNNIEHTFAQVQGRAISYKKYELRICKVESDYGYGK